MSPSLGPSALSLSGRICPEQSPRRRSRKKGPRRSVDGGGLFRVGGREAAVIGLVTERLRQGGSENARAQGWGSELGGKGGVKEELGRSGSVGGLRVAGEVVEGGGKFGRWVGSGGGHKQLQ